MIDLREAEEQTPEICLAAVQQDGLALEFIKEQTPKICLAAVKEGGLALKYVKKQTPEICLAAVKENEAALPCVFPCFEEAVSQTLERQCLH